MRGLPFAVHEDEVPRLYRWQRRIRVHYKRDIPEASPRFRAGGVSFLHEKAYLLEAPGDSGH